MKLKSHLFCLLTICIFSTLEVAGKLLGSGVSPYTLTAWRFLIGGMVILPFAVRQSQAVDFSLKIRDILRMGMLGVLNVCLSMLVLQLSIHYGKASLSAVIISINPLFVSLFAMFFLREELRFVRILGLIGGLIGIGLIVLGEAEFGSGQYRNLPLGIGLAVIAAINFGLYTVLTKKSVLAHGNLVTNSASFIIGAFVLFGINAITGKPILIDMTWNNLFLTLYLGIVITGIAYLLYFEGMKHLESNTASMYFFLKPVIASLLAYFVLNEKLSPLQI
ncbi:MAG: EamA family transporter, partial [Candidatus Cloacimonadaceae bacterium]|nr:EamA family transporter [Candidatus Cloacimonadaceae bacterium]